jgi:ABC-type branched-subunit amino acid transport system substrate-binding protein
MNKIHIVLGALLLVILGGVLVYGEKEGREDLIKIGVITDLTGPAAAYWGESTQAGAELAARELRARGYSIEIVFEDYALDAAKGASATQKLLAVDNVDALYVEFNPGAVAASSVAKGKNVPMIYDAANVSPLDESSYFFKTYLDYRAGCKAVAQKFKDEGVGKLGMLKMNLEFGEVCLRGVQEVYADVLVEGYNIDDTDYRTQLLKLKNAGATAVVNVGFEESTYTALKSLKELGYRARYGTVDDTITPKVAEAYPEQLHGAVSFGFKPADGSFAKRVNEVYGRTYPTYWGAQLAYLHVTQLAEALATCGKAPDCVAQELAKAKADARSGFHKFENRIAELEMLIKEY